MVKDKKWPLVSVIILNWNGYRDTEKCLSSVIRTRYPNFEVIVLDNGSEQREDLLLKKRFSKRNIVFIRNKKNLGYCQGNNLACKNAKGKYFIFLNNDTIVTPTWLSSLVKASELDKQIAVVQPKILSLKNRKKFDYAGAAGGYIDIFGYPFTKGRLFETTEFDKHQYDKSTEVFWASGAAMFIRSTIFKKMGMFNKIFFAYMEEIDLCWKIRSKGYKIIYEPRSLIYHKVSGSAGRDIFKKRYLEHKNNLLLLIKNYSASQLWIYLPIRFILEIISILYYCFSGKYIYAKAATRSLMHIILHFSFYLKERKKRLAYSLYDDRTVYKGSIVFQYFLRGKRTFHEVMGSRKLD